MHALSGKVAEDLVGKLRYELSEYTRAAESVQPEYIYLTGQCR